MKSAFETGVYRNVFAELGYTDEEIEKKIKDSFNTVFYGSEDERFFHTVGDDMIPAIMMQEQKECPME